MYPQRYEIDVVTAADGTFTGYTPVIHGPVHHVIYTKDGSVPFTNGVAVALTGEESGQNVWTQTGVNASANVSPRTAVQNQDGSAALFAAAGTPVVEKIVIGNERLQLAITLGGASKKGKFVIVAG